MSPLVSPPIRGYPDWQRVDNYDSGILYTAPFTTGTTTILSPVLDVSRFAYMGGFVHNTNANPCHFGAIHYSDAGGTIQIGERDFTLGGNMGFSAQLRIPNLAPFVQVFASAIGGLAFRFNAWLLGTNRYSPVEFIPASPNLFTVNQAMAAGNTTFYPNSYFAGPIQFQGAAAAGSATATFFWVDFSGVLQTFDVISLATAGAVVRASLLAPSGVWGMVVNNAAAPGSNVQISIIPSLSGST